MKDSIRNPNSSITSNTSTMAVLFPETNISYSHLFIGVGVGISIGK